MSHKSSNTEVTDTNRGPRCISLWRLCRVPPLRVRVLGVRAFVAGWGRPEGL